MGQSPTILGDIEHKLDFTPEFTHPTANARDMRATGADGHLCYRRHVDVY